MLYRVFDHIRTHWPNLSQGSGKPGKWAGFYGWKARAFAVAKTGTMGGLSDIFLSPLYEFIEALAIMTAEQQDYQELNKK